MVTVGGTLYGGTESSPLSIATRNLITGLATPDPIEPGASSTFWDSRR